LNLMDEKAHVTIGGSYYSYLNTKGCQPFVDTEDGLGNSLGMALTFEGPPFYYYLNSYDLVEVFLEVGAKVQQLPVTIMVDYVTNTGADEDKAGYLVGLRFGKAKGWGTFSGRYIYREVQKDAVLGAYTDSDFIGGGTDGKGHEIGIDVGLSKNITSSATFFANQIGIENGKDFNRLQVDVQFKF
ncbi:putative porin, partial [bacterium]|nr:putative porin [bacterium]